MKRSIDEMNAEKDLEGCSFDSLKEYRRRKAADSRSLQLWLLNESETDLLRLGTILQHDFYDTSSVDELVQALFFNHSITCIEIDSIDWDRIAPSDLAKLLGCFQRIGARMTKLTFSGSEMSSQLLSTYFWSFRNLRRVVLQYKRDVSAANEFASWNERDWGIFSNALRQHPTLEYYSIDYEVSTRADMPSNDQTALALITAPNLSEYRQTGPATGPKLSTPVLVQLICSDSLRALEYSASGFARKQLGILDWTGLPEALQYSNLRMLSLEKNGLNDEEICLIADGLRVRRMYYSDMQFLFYFLCI